MRTPSATQEVAAIQRHEGVVNYLRDQLSDAKDGMSLRTPDGIQNELDIAEAKLKRLRSGKCRIGEAA